VVKITWLLWNTTFVRVFALCSESDDKLRAVLSC